jgi:hypothetical protein
VDLKPRVCVVSLVIAFSSTSCATQTYPGPKLPRTDTARITANHASIVSIDGTALPAGRAFMLRADVHAISATGIDANGYSIGLMTLCLAAAGGANYQVRLGGIARGVPEVYDLDKGSLVQTLLVPIGQDCALSPQGGTVVSVTLPSGARAHRGVPPPNPNDAHVLSAQSLAAFAFDMLVVLPLEMLRGTLYVLAYVR